MIEEFCPKAFALKRKPAVSLKTPVAELGADGSASSSPGWHRGFVQRGRWSPANTWDESIYPIIFYDLNWNSTQPRGTKETGWQEVRIQLDMVSLRSFASRVL
jgi:hypothetical protein